MKEGTALGRLFIGLTTAIGLASNRKDDTDRMFARTNSITSLRLIFTDYAINKKDGESKIDLTQAAWVKIKYSVDDGSKVVKQATLLLDGDSTNVSTSDMDALTFKGGTRIKIYSATLFDNTDTVIGRAAKLDTDTFEVKSPKGVLYMNRIYGTVGLEILK